MTANPMVPINPIEVSGGADIVSQFPESLPAFMSRVGKDTISYPAACSMARAGTLPGVEKSPHGFGWIIIDPQAAEKALRAENPSKTRDSRTLDETKKRHGKS